MPAGHRDAEALDFSARLTAAAEEMRRKATHLQTVKEIDGAELEKLRADVYAALMQITREVEGVKRTIAAIAAAADAELKRRA